MPYTMIRFRIDDRHFRIDHRNDDDSRVVIEETGNGDVILFKITSSLHVVNMKGGTVAHGRLTDDGWAFFAHPGRQSVVAPGDSWRDLLAAEEMVAKHLIMHPDI